MYPHFSEMCSAWKLAQLKLRNPHFYAFYDDYYRRMNKNEDFGVLAMQASTLITFLKNLDTNCKFGLQQNFYIILISKKLNLHVLEASWSSLVFVRGFAQNKKKGGKSDDFANTRVKEGFFSFCSYNLYFRPIFEYF